MRQNPGAEPVFSGITRRQLIAAAGAVGIGAATLAAQPATAAQHVLARAGRYPTPSRGQTYFTRVRELAQTRGPGRLATWLETEHLEYQLGGWFFFGRLVGDAGPDDFGSFVMALQRLPVKGIDVYAGALGFDPKAQGRYEYAPIVIPKGRPGLRVVVQSNPWRVHVLSDDQATPLIAMETISGRMGQVGTTYLLAADIPADLNPSGTGRMQARVKVRDPFGVINQGYGSTAFCPQFLTPRQHEKIVDRFGGSVRRYLQKTDDPMICQGSFYYQLPFLEVDRFWIQVGDSVRSQGRSGLLWMDQLVQTYDAQAATALLDSKYEFFAIQFPDEQAALMVLHVDGANGNFPVATLYDNCSAHGRNGALRPRYSWPITGIHIEPDPTHTWRSSLSGNTYYMRYRIRLKSPDMSADLEVTMAIRNQEFREQAGGLWDYEGIGDVRGELNGRRVRGRAFLEAVPTTVSQPN